MVAPAPLSHLSDIARDSGLPDGVYQRRSWDR
jgi:hypothetical protein